jgi:hypothetical protein
MAVWHGVNLAILPQHQDRIAMLGTVVRLICWVWIIEVAAALLMYAWALCNRRRDASRTEAWPAHPRLRTSTTG